MWGFGRIEAMFGLSWQVVVLFSGFLSALGQTIGKRQVDRFGAFQVGFWRDVATLSIASVILAGMGITHLKYFWILFVYGLALSFSLAAYTAATRDDFSGSTVFSYSISQIMIILFSSVLFAEWVYFNPMSWYGRWNLLAVVLMIVSFVLYRGKAKVLRKWDKLIFVAIFMNVVGNLFAKYLLGTLGMSVYEMLVYQNIGMLVGGMYFVRRRGQTLKLGTSNILLGLVQGVFITSGVIMYLTILSGPAPLSLVSMTRRIATVLLTTSSGLFLYKESKKLDKRMGWAMVLGLVVFGLVLVANR